MRRPVSCTLNESQETLHQTAWRLIDGLTLARKDFGLLPQTITILKALVSFLPKDGGHLIVWPANTTLCERASGMSERSLRRHIDRLVTAGLIARKSSSNGKRFALRFGKSVIDAYGFDLSGLFDMQDQIIQASEHEAHRQAQIKTLRGLIKQNLYLQNGLICPKLEAEITLALRHRDNLEALQAYQDLLQLPKLDAPAAKLAVNDSPNDRHIQNTNSESIKVSERTFEPKLEECLEAVADALAFAQYPITNWAELTQLGHDLAAMIGISDQLMDKARQEMGVLAASLSVLCLAQKIKHLHRPVAYFYQLVQRAKAKTFSLQGLLRSAKACNALPARLEYCPEAS